MIENVVGTDQPLHTQFTSRKRGNVHSSPSYLSFDLDNCASKEVFINFTVSDIPFEHLNSLHVDLLM